MSAKARSRGKEGEFRQFLRDFRGQCQCGATYRLKPEQVTILDASRGAAFYAIDCPSCGRSGVGAFGPSEFLQFASAHFEGFCAGRGLPEPDRQLFTTSFRARSDALLH